MCSGALSPSVASVLSRRVAELPTRLNGAERLMESMQTGTLQRRTVRKLVGHVLLTAPGSANLCFCSAQGSRGGPFLGVIRLCKPCRSELCLAVAFVPGSRISAVAVSLCSQMLESRPARIGHHVDL